MNDRLVVLLYGEVLGTLDQLPAGQRVFRYADGLVGTTTPLSLSLPVAATAYGHRHIDPVLEGLLPDNVMVRQAVAARFGVSARNPFALLAHIGLDCAGAVQLSPPDTVDSVLAREGALVALTDDEVGHRLADLRTARPSDWLAPEERWSLGGAQAKVALRWENSTWHEAHGAEPTTHILKPGAPGFQSQALNEHLCLRAAAELGLAAATSSYVELAGEPVIVVERYDRGRADSLVTRVHQEDLCQALGVYPSRKYETDGGPGAVDIVALLRRHGSDADQAHNVTRFVEALAFNYLIGAPDAHAKNYSVLLAADRVRLAPLYDVASGLPYQTETDSGMKTGAMAVAGQRHFDRVTRGHWRRLADRAGLPGDEVVERVTDLARRLPDALVTVCTAEVATPGAAHLSARLLDPVARLCQRFLDSPEL
ncbi:MAG: type II toxin-antitoxin system HipA family toxin [Micrococcales bacterium]|nr:type II toxin-antitoxin system HipA family toxin [Micrococcales bacterium]